MIKKAIFGLLIIGIGIGIILMCLGFSITDIGKLISEQPYDKALEKGTYLEDPVIWVDTKTLEGNYDFEMTVHNPTPRKLKLKGFWQMDPTLFMISRPYLDINVDPGKTNSVKLQLMVHADSSSGLSVSKAKPPEFTGTWHWAAWNPKTNDTSIEKEYPIKRSLQLRRSFGTINYVVLIGYLIGMLAIGYIASRHIKGTRDFFIANSKLNYIVVGLSILGTYLSALTMMGLPGMSYGKHDWTYMVQLPCLVITAIVITGFVLPRYRKAGIVSIYAYLEQRIDISARIVASICFLIFSIGRMGLVLYLPALAFSTVTGTPLWFCILAMGIIITVYTVMGGIEAVVWTDAIQVVIFIIGAFLTLGYIFNQLNVETFLDIGLQYNKFRVIIPGFAIAKITTIWLILETIFQTIRIYGTQQDIAQRYMTTESTEKANRSVWIAILGYIPLGFIFYFIGTALFAFYKANPDMNLPGKADPIYPYFVVTHLPAGVAGLIIAAIFAAAMSSIDSCMNSSSTVCIEDFVKRFSKTQLSDEVYLKKAKRLTILWGALAIVMALLFMEVQYAQIVWGKLMGISTNGMLGLMALAFLPIRINKWAALTGFVCAYAALFIMMGTGVIFLLWPVIGNLVCFFVALLLNPLFIGNSSEGLKTEAP